MSIPATAATCEGDRQQHPEIGDQLTVARSQCQLQGPPLTPLGQIQLLFDPSRGARPAARLGDESAPCQRLRQGRGIRLDGRVEECLGPVSRLLAATAVVPRQDERSDEAEPSVRIVGLGVGERGAEIVVLLVESFEPLDLVRGTGGDLGTMCEIGVPREEVGDGVGVAFVVDEAGDAVGAEGLQHPESRPRSGAVGCDERSLDETLDVLEGVLTTHGLDGLDGGAAGEQREPAERSALALEQHLVAAVDRGPQPAVSFLSAPVAAPEQPKAILQSGGDLAHGEQFGLRGRELDRERQVVELGAQVAQLLVVWVDPDIRLDRPCPLEEQPRRVPAASGVR